MPAAFPLMNAYVQFGTQGSVGPATQKQTAFVDKFWDKFAASRKRAMDRIDDFRNREEKMERQIAIDRNARILKTAALVKTAFGSIPGVGAAADIAMAGAIGGPIGAAAMATGKALSYGFEGAGKASPGHMERFQYQQDRLQAIMGQKLLPVIERMTDAVEGIGTVFGGKGSQLGFPQFSGFAEARDRLQLLAAQGLPRSGGADASINLPSGMSLPGPGSETMLGAIRRNIEDAWDDSWAQKALHNMGYDDSKLQKMMKGLKRTIFD